jgi:hypothetical protein
MLTLLSTPKRFSGIFDVIQTNAITSWTHLDPRPEIILFGRDEGTAEICDALGLRHVPDVAVTEQGTPLLSDMFLRGQELASNPVVCWSNADVMFTDRLNDAAAIVGSVPGPPTWSGRRTDIEQPTPPFEAGWQDALVQRAQADGERKPPTGSTSRVHPRLFTELPPFAIGRPGYDVADMEGGRARRRRHRRHGLRVGHPPAA